ncbi:MAG: isoaspartyl peptidase/L-asparaginase [Phycisphaerales bacterium]|nr:isoaspartyl peptidase/L-asparaginase [Phycisphaerales bacterium]
MTNQWAIAIHGGAGAIPADLDPQRKADITASLASIVRASSTLLEAGAFAIDVAQHAVQLLEDEPAFNAGHGAVLCADGTHELEAAIMDGHTGSAGAVALMRTTQNPIAAARAVLKTGSHVMLVGASADAMAQRSGLPHVDNTAFTTPHRKAAFERWRDGRDSGPHHATVGAVVLDMQGKLAAATSTGGTTGKTPGRIGDAPLIGAGTWADRQVAVSCTGHGEDFMRHGTARHVSDRVGLLGETVTQATAATLAAMPDACGGLIAVSCTGEITMPFTSKGMYRAAAGSRQAVQVGIGPDSDSALD